MWRKCCPLSALFCLCLSSFASGEISQQDAFVKAEAVVREASDASMGRSTTGSMGAMAALGAGNYSSAATGALDAYGKYRNSTNQDIMGDIYKLRNIKLDSFANMRRRYAAYQPTKTTFSRLSPDFLYKGQAAVTARQWEELSGMPREGFLQALSVISESPLSASDPNLFQESKARLVNFIKTIPNADFRESLLANIGDLSVEEQVGMFQNGLANIGNYISPLAEIDKSVILAKALPGTISDEASSQKNVVVSTESEANVSLSVTGTRNPATDENARYVKQGEYFDVDVTPDDKSGSNLYASALDQLHLSKSKDSQSIFERVSARYKEFSAVGLIK